MARPLVTVLIDTYNHERFIEEAIASVLAQDFPASEMEILVVDDGSTDRTPEIVQKFAPRVRYLRKENGGQASAFNFGIPQARGEIVAFLDGDDWWAPNKLSCVTQAMAADSSVGIVGHGIITIHIDGREQAETLLEGFRFQANTIAGARLFRLRRSLLGTSRMTIRAEILRRIGSVPNSVVIEADEYLFTLASVLSGVEILPDPLAYYRLHDANLYLISASNPEKLRRKAASLAALAQGLAEQLTLHHVDVNAARTITEIIKAEADQVRLTLDGGSPIQTLQTEWTIYDVHNPDASRSRRMIKRLFLLPALLFPPKAFYGIQSRLTRSRLYRRFRDYLLPSDRQPHVAHTWRFGAAGSHPIAREDK